MFLRDYRVKVWPRPLTEDDLQWFRECYTGDLGEMRERTQSGRVWAEAKYHGGSVTVLSFWVTADMVAEGTLRLLCERSLTPARLDCCRPTSSSGIFRVS